MRTLRILLLCYKCIIAFLIITMDIDVTKRFVVLKFINEDVDCDEEDDSLFEVGLIKWLKQLDEETNAKISWPPKSEQSTAIKKEIDALPSWPIYNVTVLKCYDTLLAARNARNGYIMSSNYETECEFGRGKRKKIKRQFACDESLSTEVTKKKKFKNISTSDDSDFDRDDSAIKKYKFKHAPSPPLILFRSENNKVKQYQNNIITDSKTKKFERLQKNKQLEKKNDAMLTFSKNHKSKKDLLLTKICQARKITSVTDNKTKIIEIAREKQKCLIEDNMDSDNATEENIDPNIPREDDFSMKVQDMSSNKDVSPSTSARSINIETPELRQKSPVTSHVTAVTTPSSSCRSSSVLDVSKATFDMKAFEKKMYSLNQEISSKLDMITMNLCRLNRFLLPHEKRIIRPADLPALPLTTEEELEKFEKYLTKDDNAGATICYMSQIIGPKDNIKEATYKVLRKLISNTLAADFTLKSGKHLSKKCFEKLMLYEVVQGAILDKRPETEIPEIDAATSL
ncbi:uncharacterized protein LOC114942272 isoform X2 [Nylanderia fulva]|uniref:uncharacterized protein LOC114942272 isoform X2 n=1 Tax=Nylanderia fulva TaxID=613905 RepID=UPI0010FAF93E|nr:uncharacterized protein LOC114942272 isoform X2 [Nylanderia fulva]